MVKKARPEYFGGALNLKGDMDKVLIMMVLEERAFRSGVKAVCET